ncbi:MAG: acyltransferase, partial [Gammaproteobacteria bacterium]|nr:acyltransferase [Gammaproteobacteria bacterium]
MKAEKRSCILNIGGGYLTRRICRIYPLYLITILVSLLITQFAPGYSPRIDNVTELLRHLMLLEGESIYWAIPVEFKYYALLPVATISLYWLNKLNPFAPVAATLLAIFAIHIVWPPSETNANSIQLGPYLGIFLLGSLTALLCSGTTEPVVSRYAKPLAVAGWLSIFVGLMTVPSFWRLVVDPDATNQVFHRDFLFYGLLWCVSVTAATKGSRLFAAFFELKACRFVGRVSFSVYLWHYLVVQLISRDVEIHASLQFLLVLAITFPLSWVSYQFIE